MPEPYYATAAAVRAELGVDITVLTDAAALALIQNAEDLADELLGVWRVDDVTGRKIVQANVEAWQWTKLSRATVKLAARLYRQPKLTERLWNSVSGPDFSFSGPLGSEWGSDVESVLNQSGLRRLSTTVGGRRGRPPWYAFSYGVDEDY